jgi:hypothetical protein
MGKFQCILVLNSSFDGGLLFFKFHFENTMKYLLCPHFSFCLDDKCTLEEKLSFATNFCN